MEEKSSEEVVEMLQKGKQFSLFLYSEKFQKLPVEIEFHANAMEFVTEHEKVLWVEYQRMQEIEYERIFRLQILTFSYEKYRVALQIR